jgi:hypothetical protein
MFIDKDDNTKPLTVLMVSSTDHVTGQTGKTLAGFVSKNGATGVAAAGTFAEIDATNFPGLYKYTATAGEVDTLGDWVLHVTATGCDPLDERRFVRLSAAQAILVTPANKLATDASGRVTVGAIIASAAQTVRDEVWNALTSALTTVGSIGKLLADKIGLLAVNGSGFVTATNGGGGGLTQQDVVDALKLAPTGGLASGVSGSPAKALADNLNAPVGSVPTALLDLANGVATGLTVRGWMRGMMVTGGVGGLLTGLTGGTGDNTGSFKSLISAAEACSFTADQYGNRSVATWNNTTLLDNTKW